MDGVGGADLEKRLLDALDVLRNSNVHTQQVLADKFATKYRADVKSHAKCRVDAIKLYDMLDKAGVVKKRESPKSGRNFGAIRMVIYYELKIKNKEAAKKRIAQYVEEYSTASK